MKKLSFQNDGATKFELPITSRGEIVVKSPLDFESVRSYVLSISATVSTFIIQKPFKMAKAFCNTGLIWLFDWLIFFWFLSHRAFCWVHREFLSCYTCCNMGHCWGVFFWGGGFIWSEIEVSLIVYLNLVYRKLIIKI